MNTTSKTMIMIMAALLTGSVTAIPQRFQFPSNFDSNQMGYSPSSGNSNNMFESAFGNMNKGMNQQNGYQPNYNSQQKMPQGNWQQGGEYQPMQPMEPQRPGSNPQQQQQGGEYQPMQPMQPMQPQRPGSNPQQQQGGEYQPMEPQRPGSSPQQKGPESNPQQPQAPDYNSQQSGQPGGNGQCKENTSLPKKFPRDIEMNKNAPQIPKGQCTEWADGRYYELTGKHALFNGDAHKWNELAQAASGWEVSDKPSVPSIMVIEQNSQGTGQYGHVAVVESISGDSICTSNWNAPTLGSTTYNNYKAGQGASFIKYVGK